MANVSGILSDGKITVAKKDVKKFKKGTAEKYGFAGYHHVLIIAALAVVYVWDTREAVAIVPVSSIDEKDLTKSVRDNGDQVKMSEMTPEFQATVQAITAAEQARIAEVAKAKQLKLEKAAAKAAKATEEPQTANEVVGDSPYCPDANVGVQA
jgi:urea transporter